jgi:hypothetical protein
MPDNEKTPAPTTQVVITYFGWNTLTIIYFIIVIIALIVSIITVRLIVLNDYYDKIRVCEPIYFFIGKKTACKKFIKKAVEKAIAENNEYSTKLTNKQIIKKIIQSDTFQTKNDEEDAAELPNNDRTFRNGMTENGMEKNNEGDSAEVPNVWNSFINTYDKFKETAYNNYLAMVGFIRSLIDLFWRVVYTTLRKAIE